MYERQRNHWPTPKGRLATFAYRADTNDWNTIQACTAEDEYGLRGLELSGWALDIGGYVGSVSIPLALDNPGLRVVAVEAVPDNAALIRENAALNGVEDRVTVIEMAAAAPGVRSTNVAYGYVGDENALHHAFVGNSTIVATTDCTVKDTDAVSLSRLIAREGTLPSFMKIDCEGCEWGVLTDPAADDLPLIRGEWHNVNGMSRDDLVRLLPNHDVTFTGPEGGPGGFEARRKD